MITDSTDRITAFQEKPKKPLSDLASMGIYIFSWPVLREYLSKDKDNPNSEHDFGKNIIPAMLNDNKKLQVYRFSGYWRDVGTLASLHEANMDIALDGREFDLYDGNRSLTIYTEDTYSVPQYIGPNGSIKRSIANQGALILGSVDTCVISSNVVVEEGASCYKCVIMEGAKVKKGAKVENAIIAPNSVIKANSEVNLGTNEVILISK
jgi:glucose-1-phosphate adenylyltransferase